MKKIFTMTMVFCLFLLSGCVQIGMTPANYVQVEFQGEDGDGVANYTFDEEAFVDGEMGISYEEAASNADSEPIIQELEAMEVVIEPATNLSNGDEVEVTTIVPEEAEYIEGGTETETVSGLE